MERKSGPKPLSIFTAIFVASLLMASTPGSEALIGCYYTCLIRCIFQGWAEITCAIRCLRQCAHRPPELGKNLTVDSEFYCTLGCSTASCSHLSTKTNPAEKEVNDCVDSCAKTCSKN